MTFKILCKVLFLEVRHPEQQFIAFVRSIIHELEGQGMKKTEDGYKYQLYLISVS